jgi:hypothetical protein
VSDETLTEDERKALLKAWPWPQEAATTSSGFNDVVAAVEEITADLRARLAAAEALCEEHKRLVNPAPYTTERALIERLDAIVGRDHSPGCDALSHDDEDSCSCGRYDDVAALAPGSAGDSHE